MENKYDDTKKDMKPRETHAEVKTRMFGNATSRKYAFAKEQRQNPTVAEAIMWEELRGKKLGGFKFRRQHPYNRFVLDFYCVSEQLSIEIDGGVHNTPENIEYDAVRTKILQDNGITEMRFSNETVLNNRTKVLADILEKLILLKSKR